MELHGEHGQLPVAHPLDGAVVEVAVRHDEPPRVDAVRIHGEAVVLRGDGAAVPLEVDDPVVGAPVPEFELVRPATERQRDDMVPEADAEDGQRPAPDGFAHGADAVGRLLRGAMTLAQETGIIRHANQRHDDEYEVANPPGHGAEYEARGV